MRIREPRGDASRPAQRLPRELLRDLVHDAPIELAVRVDEGVGRLPRATPPHVSRGRAPLATRGRAIALPTLRRRHRGVGGRLGRPATGGQLGLQLGELGLGCRQVALQPPREAGV